MHEKLLEKTEEKINEILEEDINASNLEHLDKLVDIYKDVKEVECMYRGYDNYGNYSRYDGYGDYDRHRDSYGRRMRDSRGRYKGHDYMDEMADHYGRYEDGRHEYNRGNYGAKDETLKSLEYMLESAVRFFEMLKSEANSSEEVELIRQYSQRISQM